VTQTPAVPDRNEVELVWTELAEGKRSRDDAHSWSKPWVEEFDDRIDDPMVLSAVQTLHGFTILKKGESGAQSDEFIHSDEDVVRELKAWQLECLEHDRDPEAWIAARYEAAFKAEPSLRDRLKPQ